MTIVIYGGGFNPPHLGHVEAAKAVAEQLCPDKLLIIPTGEPPHKSFAAGSPGPMQRLELCRLAFAGIPVAEVSDMELRRQGKSYTADTVTAIKNQYPDSDITITVGADMLQCFEKWHRFEYLLESCALAVVPREDDDAAAMELAAQRLRDLYSARVEIISYQPLPMRSGEICAKLPLRMGADMLNDAVYSEIIRQGWYGALPELGWLREKSMAYLAPERIAHVSGCECEAVQLARHYGENEDTAAVAGILHDITKKCNYEEQLKLCAKYGIVCDAAELENPKLLHAKTGAALSRDLFGISEEIYQAIRWHTTGKPNMSKLEKIIYLADYIEPTRDFDGVEELRKASYDDLDEGMRLGLEMSLEELRAKDKEPYKDTVEAYIWYNTKEEK